MIAFETLQTQSNQTNNQSKQTNQATMSTEQKRRGRKPKHTPETIKPQLDTTQMTTFHFNFSDAAVELLTYFATKHRYDERKIFKENWEKWIKESEVDECISAETRRLSEEGYSGDVVSKMFKSVRYYYRKKPTVPVEPKKRKQYEHVSAETLAQIDQHIIRQIREHTDSSTKQCSISPARSFAKYETEYGLKPDDGKYAKYKKTYKNRYFILSNTIKPNK